MRKLFAVLAVVLGIAAMAPVVAHATDQNNNARFYGAAAGAGGR